MLDDQVTVLIPTSPIPRHPDTSLIEECVSSIRRYFPTAHFIILVDGLRPAVEFRRGQYEGYKKNLSELCVSGKLGNTKLSVFASPVQQAIMTRNALEHHVQTPLILFVEHDAILRAQPALEWEAMFDVVLLDKANLVRLYNWDRIWHEHQYLMRGELEHRGVKFIKTVQYSQWPLLSSSDYHRKLLTRIPKMQRTMIEPAVYYQVAAEEWEKNKVVIYYPENALTFTHKDGRVDEVTGKKDPAEW